MNITKYETELEETLDSLLEDLLLLDALTAKSAADYSPLLREISAKLFPQTHRRMLDYLTQHAVELYVLTHSDKKGRVL